MKANPSHNWIKLEKWKQKGKEAKPSIAQSVSTYTGPDDGDSKHLWNTAFYLPHYTVQHFRRQPSSNL
jgi:hypothetical protein